MDSATTLPFTLSPSTSPVPPQRRAEILANPGFGRVFTDNMVVIRYEEGKGWHDARVQPYAPLSLDPAAAVLHYAQEIFEGMKAYRTAEGHITLFRPQANAARFRKSAERLAMAQVPEDLFVEAVRQLVRIDAAWVPGNPDESLYIRPYMIASETFLGVKPAAQYLFMVIASPSGPISGRRRSASGCPISAALPPAARVRPSAAAITPQASWPSRKPRGMAARRSCSLMRWSAAGLRKWAA